LLPHTRFDPRWEGARVNLDDQWKKIIQVRSGNEPDNAILTTAWESISDSDNTLNLLFHVAKIQAPSL